MAATLAPLTWSALIIFFSCLGLTWVLTPAVMRLASAVGAVDAGGHRKVYAGKPMPLLGGLAIALPFIGLCVIAALFPGKFGLPADGGLRMGGLAAAASLLVVVGIRDDRTGMKARTKLMFQVIAALIACLSGAAVGSIEIPGVGFVHIDPISGGLLSIVWIVGLSNAYNLIDGIDGLATGVALVGAAGLAVLAALMGADGTLLLGVALSGGALAFLRYNFNPARIFLGDTGSMFLGFVLANLALMGGAGIHGEAVFAAAPAMLLGLPVVDTLTSMGRRFVRGRPILTGDQGHIHHRLLRRPFTHRRVALTLYAVAAAMAIAAILFGLMPEGSWEAWLALGAYAMTVVGLLRMVDYLRLDLLLNMLRMRRRNRMLTAFGQYATLKLSSLRPGTLAPGEVLWIIARELSLSRLEVFHEDGTPLLRWVEESGRERNAPVRPVPHEMKVNVSDGRRVVLRYAHDQAFDAYVQNDIQACLASIFEEARVLDRMASAEIITPRLVLQDFGV